jgi:N-hydroxyarylamine O-acetyltransferase
MPFCDSAAFDLANYLKRIGYQGRVEANLQTLAALQRTHVHSVPFENLDVQLRRSVGLDLDHCYDKIVKRRRGGWCYELNGLFGWALQKIGFSVTRISAGVMRERAGDAQLGNHLCLLVQLDQPYLVDVGFGGSLAYPLPLEATSHDHSPYRIWLQQLDDGYWRFSEQAHDDPFSFDFREDVADEELFRLKCIMLQTSADSTFVQNLVVQRRIRDIHVALRGRVLTTLTASGVSKKDLGSPEELVATLNKMFDLDVPEARDLWPAICARHEALFANLRTD